MENFIFLCSGFYQNSYLLLQFFLTVSEVRKLLSCVIDHENNNGFAWNTFHPSFCSSKRLLSLP